MQIKGMLTMLTFLPLLGSLIILFFPKGIFKSIRSFAVIITLMNLLLTILIGTKFSMTATGFQLQEIYTWVPSLGIQIHFGLDGVSLLMVFLTTLLSFTACLSSFFVKNRVKEYFSLFLLLESGLIGVFLALDLILFYVFWEIVLVPMYFLIAIWGGERKLYASIKFFLYTLIGSLFMLIAILAIYFKADPHTFSIPMLIQQSNILKGWTLGMPIFGALFFGFAIKIPSFPFHTWLPDAHVEAPAPISVLLAGVLLKMGGYGLLRIGVGIMPDAAKAWGQVMIILGVIGIIYGALCALPQKDIKKLVAYTSVNHMGFVLLAIGTYALTRVSSPDIASIALKGAVLVMFSHGLTTGLLFLLVGYIYERTHTRDIEKISGLGGFLPILSIMLIIASFASMGLPSMSGFVGEFLSLQSVFAVVPWAAWSAVIGLVVNAAVMLWMMQRILFGTKNPDMKPTKDAGFREIISAVPLFCFTFLIGIFPTPILHLIERFVG